MVLASFAGAAATATAATHHGPSTARITPHVTSPSAGVTVKATPVNIPLATAQAGTVTSLPTVTITDPGTIPSGDTVTLTLESAPAGFGLTPGQTPTVTATGGVAVSSPATVNAAAGTISFTVTKTATTTPSVYTVSGATVVGGATTEPDGFDLSLTASHSSGGPTPTPVVDVPATAPIALGAVTSIIPAAYGAQAPDTAAVLFRAEENGNPTSAVLASDYEPQDAESANFLASAARTAILLTDPTTLSPAVSSVLSDYTSITTIYIVGGTSVVSAAIQTQLQGEGKTVVRLAGTDQYATNQFVVNYASQNFGTVDTSLAVDYTTEAQYNDTSGTSSATTTASGEENTAIIASGDIKSFQDGVVSGPLSYDEGLPVILTTPTTLSSTAQGLLAEGSYKQVIVLGGPLAVSDAVVGQLTASTATGGAGVTVFRIAGTDASDTSTKLASFLLANDDTSKDFGPVDDGVANGGVLIARGNGFQDALAAGPYAGNDGDTPILLTENATTLGAPLTAYLKALAATSTTDPDGVFAIQAIGGPLSITAAVQTAANAAQFSGLTP